MHQHLKLSLAIFIGLLTGCGQPPKPFTEKRVVIANQETVKVPELHLSITNNGCGRAWMSEEEGKPSYEKPFCDLVIKQNDSTIRAGKNFNPIYIGNVKIVVDRMNPWGREEDSVPAGGCRVIISKLPDNAR